jgi:UrcA family protein
MKDYIARFAGVATLALAALPIAALTTAAHAQTGKVYVADLNLASPAGQKAAVSRIVHLSHEMCANERNLTQKDACETAVSHEARTQLAAATSSQFASR